MKIEFSEYIGCTTVHHSQNGIDVQRYSLPQFKINDLDGFRITTLGIDEARWFKKGDYLKLQEEYDWLCKSVEQVNGHIVELSKSIQEHDVTPHLTNAYLEMMRSFVERLQNLSERRIAIGAALKWIGNTEEKPEPVKWLD